MVLFYNPSSPSFCIANNRTGSDLTDAQWDLSCDSLYIGHNSLGVGYLGLVGLVCSVAGIIWKKHLGLLGDNKPLQPLTWVNLGLILLFTVGFQIWICITDIQSVESFLLPSGMNAILLFFSSVRGLQNRGGDTLDIMNIIGIILMILGWGFAIAGVVGVVMLVVVEIHGGAIAIGAVQCVLVSFHILSLLVLAILTLTPNGIKKLRTPSAMIFFGPVAMAIVLSISIGILMLCYTVNTSANKVTWPTYLFIAFIVAGTLKEGFESWKQKNSGDDNSYNKT